MRCCRRWLRVPMAPSTLQQPAAPDACDHDYRETRETRPLLQRKHTWGEEGGTQLRLLPLNWIASLSLSLSRSDPQSAAVCLLKKKSHKIHEESPSLAPASYLNCESNHSQHLSLSLLSSDHRCTGVTSRVTASGAVAGRDAATHAQQSRHIHSTSVGPTRSQRVLLTNCTQANQQQWE